MQRRSACPKFAARISAKILNGNLRDIDLSERQRLPFACRLGFVVDVINKYRHPLISCTMRIHRTTDFPRGFDLNSFRACFHRIVWVNTFYQKIGMTVEIVVLSECARMLRNTRCQ